MSQPLQYDEVIEYLLNPNNYSSPKPQDVIDLIKCLINQTLDM